MQLPFVTVQRYKTNDLQGFVLQESKKLLVLQYFVDFIMNGILILDKRYIHNIQMNQSSKYQLKMMKHFGLIKDINPVHFNVKNWRNFLIALPANTPIV